MLVDRLRTEIDGQGLIEWDLNADSTISRAHQHAAGARRDPDAQAQPPHGPVREEPADYGLGRSRGGLTTKFHTVAEQGQMLMGLVVTAGQRGDSPQLGPVLDEVRVRRINAGSLLMGIRLSWRTPDPSGQDSAS